MSCQVQQSSCICIEIIQAEPACLHILEHSFFSSLSKTISMRACASPSLVNSLWRSNAYSSLVFCSEIGASVLIDDNPIYARDCAQAGMQVLLYDWDLSYPWAKTADGLVNSPQTKCHSQAVERKILRSVAFIELCLIHMASICHDCRTLNSYANSARIGYWS